MTDGFWEFAVAPIALAVGGAITVWWQSRQNKAEKAVEDERQRDHDDLAELRSYRARLDEELQKCRSSEVTLRADLESLRVESARMTQQIDTLRSDLADALAAIKAQAVRIDQLEGEKAELEVAVVANTSAREGLQARLNNIEREQQLRRDGKLLTRESDKPRRRRAE